MKTQRKEDTYFRVLYKEPGESKPVTLKAKSINDSSLGLSFVCISDFIFDTQNIVVDPKEEELSKRYEKVRSLHLSIYMILSIEEVGVQNDGLHFRHDKSNLLVLSNQDNK
ncbi:MAG: DUF1820 family protein [Bdellovibrionota bacterium]